MNRDEILLIVKKWLHESLVSFALSGWLHKYFRTIRTKQGDIERASKEKSHPSVRGVLASAPPPPTLLYRTFADEILLSEHSCH